MMMIMMMSVNILGDSPVGGSWGVRRGIDPRKDKCLHTSQAVGNGSMHVSLLGSDSRATQSTHKGYRGHSQGGPIRDVPLGLHTGCLNGTPWASHPGVTQGPTLGSAMLPWVSSWEIPMWGGILGSQ